MKKLMLALVPIILLAGIGYWFWSLGSIPVTSPRSVELSIQQKGVQVKQPGSSEWQEATNGMHVEKGWSIKTDGSGLATVRFYNQGESRLDHNSEMMISEAAAGDSAGVHFKAEVTLVAGHVWSRVLRLLDIDSSYDVRTSEVVATVRGTAFDVEKNTKGTVAVSVAESAVTVAPAAKQFGASKAVAEGMSAIFSASGTSTSEHALTDAERASGWYVSNQVADQTFIKNEIDRRTNELKQLDGPLPDSPLNSIAALSERVHLSLASDATKNVLLEQYLSRRLYHLIDLVQSGKTGLASQEFSRIENDIQAQLDSKNTASNTDYIRAAVLRMSLLMDDANPNDALYPFKQKVENLFETISSSSDLSRFYARMLAFDSRLDEADRAIAANSLTDAQTMLDGVKSGVENIRRDSAPMIPSLTDEYRAAFEGKLSALEVRQQVIRTKLDSAKHPIAQPSATSTEPLSGMDQTAATSTLSQSTSSQVFVSIALKISPNPIVIGQRAKMTVKAKRADGTEKDVTAFSQFTSMQYVGKLNGPSYVATGMGTDDITAQYQDHGITLEGTATIKTTGEVKLTDLVISSSAGTSLQTGEKTTLTATARYNNGVTKNVTNQTVFVIVSGAGSLQGTIFTPDPSSNETMIAGTFKDQNLTSIGSIKISTGL